ncbi:MAG: hypothetical protein KIT84_35610 [Labilithrix sp.]|nr:hypothetical protein [Labilithrix sp.]MCW5816380.1 hypothetical protein [Labilithrix sp.]
MIRLALEIARALSVARAAERLRLHAGPAEAVATQRRRGARRRRRSARGRRRLRRAITMVDARWPGGGNCFRRVLIELALDAGAARERLVFGLDVGRTGHVAFEGTEDVTFDVAFVLGPE